LTEIDSRDLTLSVNEGVSIKLSREERALVVAWFTRHEETLPEPVRLLLKEPLAKLTSSGLSQKDYNQYGRQLARALGLIPSSERRRPSGRPLSNARAGQKNKGPRTRAARNGQRSAAEVQALVSSARCQGGLQRLEQSTEETEAMCNDVGGGAEDERGSMPSTQAEGHTEPKKLSPAKEAAIVEQTAAFVARAQLGDGADPALASTGEALMNAEVVCVDEDQVLVPAKLPEGVAETNVVKTLVEPRVRYDFAVTVTEIQLDVEKKIVVTKDGERRVISGDVHEHGPKGFAVTWQALATLAVMIGQFAMPLNRLGTMLSTATKKFTSTSLGRMAHYVAVRFAPIYLALMEQLADGDILCGDDTSCRVLEVSSYYARTREGQQAANESPPWRSYGTVAEANEAYLDCIRRRAALLARRAEGDREAKKTPAPEPPLRVLIGRELGFESPRKDGDGPKQSLNTTVITGRTDAEDPSSLVVFYRSHLGSLGNLLEMLLARRQPTKRKLTIQADLSTTNLVTDPALTSWFEVELVGCSAHARRPFAQYEDQDPKHAAVVLALFGMLAIHEDTLDRHGRNRENTLAVRGVDSRKMWERLKDACLKLAQRWTKATPLGSAARYILKHYERLTAYLSNPRLRATNNLQERLLRTEKLIEKSSMFRQSVEGRVVLDILRTILQTAVAAGAAPHEYLVDVMKAAPAEIEAHPERYTPAEWAKRRRHAREEAIASQPAA
jgi:hypothetical protein